MARYSSRPQDVLWFLVVAVCAARHAARSVRPDCIPRPGVWNASAQLGAAQPAGSNGPTQRPVTTRRQTPSPPLAWRRCSLSRFPHGRRSGDLVLLGIPVVRCRRRVCALTYRASPSLDPCRVQPDPPHAQLMIGQRVQKVPASARVVCVRSVPGKAVVDLPEAVPAAHPMLPTSAAPKLPVVHAALGTTTHRPELSRQRHLPAYR